MGMFIPFTSSELYSIRNMARLDYERSMYVLKSDIETLKRTGYDGMRSLIARDMDELARLRKLIAHTNQLLKEAQIREIQDLL